MVYTLSPTFRLVFVRWGFVLLKSFCTFVPMKKRTEDLFLTMMLILVSTVFVMRLGILIVDSFLKF